MSIQVYINSTSAYFPNDPVSNDEMEEYLGYIDGRPSKSKKIVLRNNGIINRYYALDKNGKSTHTNAQMTALAVKELFKDDPEKIKEIRNTAINSVFADEVQGMDEHSREILEKVINYMEKKYISVPMIMAKEILINS